MSKVPVAIAAVALAIPTLTASVQAWGDDGHQIIGRIAARTLTSTTRQRIVTILRHGGDDALRLPQLLGGPDAPQPSVATLGEALGRMAAWPDHMPDGRGRTAPWHYINIGLFEGPRTTVDRCAAGCITQVISTLAAHIRAGESMTLREDSGTRTFPVDQQLRFLAHFIGDVHQPLHASTNADAGGNCVAVTGFDGLFNLHAVWDISLVRLVRKRTLDGTATALLAEFQDDRLSAGVTDPQQIAAESFALASREIYPKTRPAPVPVIDHFVGLTPAECRTKAPPEIRSMVVDGPASFDNAATRRLVREQLFKAGVRLAAVLNGVFD